MNGGWNKIKYVSAVYMLQGKYVCVSNFAQAQVNEFIYKLNTAYYFHCGYNFWYIAWETMNIVIALVIVCL